MTDPIADMLTRIRNAVMVYHDSVDVPASKLKIEWPASSRRKGSSATTSVIDDGKQGIVRMYSEVRPPTRAGDHGASSGSAARA